MAAGSETKDGEQYVELPIKTVEEALKDLGSYRLRTTCHDFNYV